MNFSAGCIRGVTRTRTGVRKQVVADICSARGPWCPCHPLTLTLSLLSFYPIPPPPPLPQCCRPEPDCWIVSRCRREAERQKMRVKQFFSPSLSLFPFFFCGLTFSAGGPSTPKVERGWTQLQRRTCPRHK